MADARYYLYKLRTTPPRVIARKLAARVRVRLERDRARRGDATRPTYALGEAPGPLLRYFTLPQTPPPARLAALAALYLEHRFDLLGSGWVRVRHGMTCRGVEGHVLPPARPPADLAELVTRANREESRRVRALISPGYEPIDWQLDYKSGFHWSEATWSCDVAYGGVPGVDVKVPWELARLQHLPQLALAACLEGADRAGLAREFRDEVLDFVAANPPRFGVDWTCTMDVGIRAANILAGYDLFRAGGSEFDEPFERVLERSMLEHGRHIRANLEWSEELRSNHYLADICGLLFVAAYLPSAPETDEWLRFAHAELLAEAATQFHADGSNFEASTSYHRLSGEMVAYCAALLLALPEGKRAVLGVEPVPPALAERLALMARFTVDATRPDGRVAQIGDDDSGRFLKLAPAVAMLTTAEARGRYANLAGFDELPDGAPFPVEDVLDHRHLVATIAGIVPAPELENFAAPSAFDTALVRALVAGGERATRGGWPAREWRLSADDVEDGEGAVVTEHRAGDGGDLRDGLTLAAYPGFGLYVFRSPRLFLAVRCGDVGQNGNGGHAHNDQLSIELVLDDRDVVRDPGTYLYTPLPAARNAYRSVKAHAAPRLDGREPSRIDLELFQLHGDPEAECLLFEGAHFLGRHTAYGSALYRRVEVLADRVRLTDWCEDAGATVVAGEPGVPFSPAYGVVERSRP